MSAHPAATECTAPTLLSLSGSPPRGRTFRCFGPSRPEPRPGWSSSSSPTSEDAHSSDLRQVTGRNLLPVWTLHLDQVGVSRLCSRPPGLSLQSVHVVQRSLPHRRKMTTLVTQLVPVIGLNSQNAQVSRFCPLRAAPAGLVSVCHSRCCRRPSAGRPPGGSKTARHLCLVHRTPNPPGDRAGQRCDGLIRL